MDLNSVHGRYSVRLLLHCFVMLWLAGSAAADTAVRLDGLTLVRIGTGGVDGSYFPVGSLIAESISQPPADGSDGLLGVAQQANGSVTNVRDLDAGRLEAGLAQADVAYWAYTGSGPFADRAPLTSLRSIATLYPESVHFVARRGSGIRSIADLAGKSVSLGEPGSGTLADIHRLLNAFGVRAEQISAVYLRPADAVERLIDDRLDAFFMIAGHPIELIEDLIALNVVELLPIEGPGVDRLIHDHAFFSRVVLEAGVYPRQPPLTTLAVGAQLLVRADLDETLIYRLTALLWSEPSRRRLDAHPKGAQILLDNALHGLAVPLHPGAERYYREVGLFERSAPAPDRAAGARRG